MEVWKNCRIFAVRNRKIIKMLGINAPKELVRGEYAKAIRKAVRDSWRAKGEAPLQTKKPTGAYHFVWK